MNNHATVIVDFNNLFTGSQNFHRFKTLNDSAMKVAFAFSAIDALRKDVEGLSVLPIMDHHFDDENLARLSSSELDILDPQRIYMVPDVLQKLKKRGKEVEADHFVLRLAQMRSSFVLSRDNFREVRDPIDQQELALPESQRIYPLYIESVDRWYFIMGNEFSSFLASAWCVNTMKDLKILRWGKSKASFDDFVSATYSRRQAEFLLQIEQLPQFKSVALSSSYDVLSDIEIRSQLFSDLIEIENEYRAQLLFQSPPLKTKISSRFGNLPLIGFREELQTGSDDQGATETKPVVKTTSHFEQPSKFVGLVDQLDTVETLNVYKIVVVGQLRKSVEGRCFLKWLRADLEVHVAFSFDHADIPNRSLVRVTGRVTMTEGKYLVTVDDPKDVVAVGLGELFDTVQARTSGVDEVSVWVLPRFPWRGSWHSRPRPRRQPNLSEGHHRVPPFEKSSVAAESRSKPVVEAAPLTQYDLEPQLKVRRPRNSRRVIAGVVVVVSLVTTLLVVLRSADESAPERPSGATWPVFRS